MAVRTLYRGRSPFRRTCIAARYTRGLSTLPNNPSIYVFPDKSSLNGHLLSFLPTDPPKPQLCVGSTTVVPPTADSLTENHKFLSILHSVIGIHAHEDPDVQSQAQAMASTGGSNLGSGGSLFPQQRQRRKGSSYGGGPGGGGDGAGGASSQGGMGGAGRGGYIHVYDYRHPPDYGRIPDPEDIFGSLEVDGAGNFVDGHGNYQTSGTYRVCTRDGILSLSSFLRQRLFERLRLEEQMLG